eukprot:4747733-Lingulodinium_polyedra.AAC.1
MHAAKRQLRQGRPDPRAALPPRALTAQRDPGEGHLEGVQGHRFRDLCQAVCSDGGGSGGS